MSANSLSSRPVSRTLAALLFALLASSLVTGCTRTIKVRLEQAARLQTPSRERIPLRAGLMLDSAFCAYTHKFQNAGDTMLFPFGPTLQQHAVGLCEQTFQHVSVSTNGVVPSGVDVVLTPAVQKMGYAVGGKKMMFTLLVQWMLRDRENQKILWMETADGQAADHYKSVFQSLFDQI